MMGFSVILGLPSADLGTWGFSGHDSAGFCCMRGVIGQAFERGGRGYLTQPLRVDRRLLEGRCNRRTGGVGPWRKSHGLKY